jgi:hypothetical protein
VITPTQMIANAEIFSIRIFLACPLARVLPPDEPVTAEFRFRPVVRLRAGSCASRTATR